MIIAVLIGSPRKKDGYRICKLIEENFSECSDCEFQYLFLKDYYVEDCKGCEQCFQKGEAYCPCKDELPDIKTALLKADGIIFTSPVYACQVTGLMKRTIDRLSYLFHRQELVGKPALIVVTTAGGGHKATGKYLKMTACGWGCNLVGEISIISPMFFKTEHAQPLQGYRQRYHDSRIGVIQQLSGKFEAAARSCTLANPSFYDILMFQCLRSKTFCSKADYDFWKERGWLESNYFYEVDLNFMKRLFAGMIRAYVDFLGKNMFTRSR